MALDSNTPDPAKQNSPTLGGSEIPEPATATAEAAPAPALTPEEQMALYEKDLKENDWGHQPC